MDIHVLYQLPWRKKGGYTYRAVFVFVLQQEHGARPNLHVIGTRLQSPTLFIPWSLTATPVTQRYCVHSIRWEVHDP